MTNYDPRLVGMLTRTALNQLWQASPEAFPGHEDYVGCCPVCCAPCSALKQLAETGELEHYVKGWQEMPPENSSWWDAINDRVDREWLAGAWSNTDKLGCHLEES